MMRREGGVEGLTLVFLALLAGVVAYLALNLRHYQRVDYGNLVEQEQLKHQLESRIAHLEQLITRLAELEQIRRAELDSMLDQAKTDLRTEVQQAREQILSEVLEHPATLDEYLFRESARRPSGLPPVSDPHCVPSGAVTRDRREVPGVPLQRMLQSPRQQQVAELLELGYSHQDISRILTVSRHEVELIASLLFQEERT